MQHLTKQIATQIVSQTRLRMLYETHVCMKPAGSGVTSVTQAINTNVEGLTKKCVDVPNSPVGPGASKDKEYKNPEYFCYHLESFAEAEVELAKFRLPAPSNKRPFTQ